MKKITTVIMAIITTSAFAFEDYATIRHVEPQYSSVNSPVEVCRDEIVQEQVYQQPPQQQQQGKNYGGAVIGGLAGGILGNQVGGGSGKTAATAAGAVIGALVGDNMSNQGGGNLQYQQPQQQQPQVTSRKVKNCFTEYETKNIITGYRVDARYNGKPIVFTTQEKPIGSKVRVQVTVDPIF